MGRVRRRAVGPVDRRIGEVLAVAEREVDPRVAIRRPRLQQQHAVTAGLRKSGGEDAAGAARADHDEVECALRIHWRSEVPQASRKPAVPGAKRSSIAGFVAISFCSWRYPSSVPTLFRFDSVSPIGNGSPPKKAMVSAQ